LEAVAVRALGNFNVIFCAVEIPDRDDFYILNPSPQPKTFSRL